MPIATPPDKPGKAVSRTRPPEECRLCRATKPLLKSHYIPASFYRLLKGRQHPVAITPKVSTFTDQQFTGYMLCHDCEERFNRDGEDWLLKHCWRNLTTFPLQDILSSVTPAASGSDWASFAGAYVPAVKVDHLAYFAASVFWRGSLKGWRSVANHVPQQLELGPYAEELRLFLLGKSAFPERIVLLTFVSSHSKQNVPGLVTPPHEAGHQHLYRRYSFTIPGITFEMLVGGRIPAGARALCMVRSKERLIHTSKDWDKNLAANVMRSIGRGHSVGKLARLRAERPAAGSSSPDRRRTR